MYINKVLKNVINTDYINMTLLYIKPRNNQKDAKKSQLKKIYIVISMV